MCVHTNEVPHLKNEQRGKYYSTQPTISEIVQV